MARKITILIALLGAVLLQTVAGAAPRPKRSRGNSQLPLLVTVIHHHSTRGILAHGLPVLSAVGGKGTLGVVVHELERTFVPPEEVSDPGLPGGLGNVQRISIGSPGADGLYTGRKFAELPAGHLTDEGIRLLAQAGWEISFHGADHTPQSTIVQQVDGPGKLRRAYEAGVGEIRRILNDPSYPVRTNTLPSNGWSPEVREVAREWFDWTEIRWAGSHQHVPVMYSPWQDPHGSFNSVDFQRATYDGLQDLDELVRFGRSESSGWLIIQIHDVVERLEDSPDPPRAMLVEEYSYLIQQLQQAGARFVTLSEGAEAIARDNPGNRVRNTLFAHNAFHSRDDLLAPMDWAVAGTPEESAGVEFSLDGEVMFQSLHVPGRLTLKQWISPNLFDEHRFVLRARADLSGAETGSVLVSLRGPLGEKLAVIGPAGGDICLEIAQSEIAVEPLGERDIVLEIRATDLLGTASLSDLSLVPMRTGRQKCRSSAR